MKCTCSCAAACRHLKASSVLALGRLHLPQDQSSQLQLLFAMFSLVYSCCFGVTAMAGAVLLSSLLL